MTVTFGDLATCVSRLQTSCVANLAAPGSGATPAHFEACAVAEQTEPCANYYDAVVPAACLPPAGTAAVGAACAFSSQCQTGFCALNDREVCGGCATQPQAGRALRDLRLRRGPHLPPGHRDLRRRHLRRRGLHRHGRSASWLHVPGPQEEHGRRLHAQRRRRRCLRRRGAHGPPVRCERRLLLRARRARRRHLPADHRRLLPAPPAAMSRASPPSAAPAACA